MATWNDILKLTKTNGITNRYAAPAPAGVKYTTGRHGGVDMVLKNDNVPSFSNGTVYKTGYDPDGWGNYAVVKNNDGFYTIYAHMNKTSVKAGDKVTEGSLIGVQGQTGQAKGKHLHLEVRSDYANNKSTLNPVTYFAKNPDSLSNRLDNQITQAEMNGTAPWSLEKVEARNAFLNNLPESLQGLSMSALLRLGFLVVGGFLIYIAITKGMFGGSGE